MFNHSEGRTTCSVQRATCSLTGIDQWGLRLCSCDHIPCEIEYMLTQ